MSIFPFANLLRKHSQFVNPFVLTWCKANSDLRQLRRVPALRAKPSAPSAGIRESKQSRQMEPTKPMEPRDRKDTKSIHVHPNCMIKKRSQKGAKKSQLRNQWSQWSHKWSHAKVGFWLQHLTHCVETQWLPEKSEEGKRRSRPNSYDTLY